MRPETQHTANAVSRRSERSYQKSGFAYGQKIWVQFSALLISQKTLYQIERA